LREMAWLRRTLDAIFSVLFGSGVAVLGLWLIPYQFVIKQAVLIWLGNVRASGMVSRWATPIAVLAGLSAWMEWSFLYKLNAEWNALKPNPSALVGEKK